MATPLVSPVFYVWHPDTGLPLSGGWIWSYEPGSTTPKPTYMSADGSDQNANPVPLNAAGYASVFLDGLYRIVITDAGGDVLYDFDNVDDFSGQTGDEWILPTEATYVSPASFSVSGDMTGTFSPGRALKIEDSESFVAYVQSAAYSGGLTVVTFYSGTMATAGLSSVSIGLVSVAPLSMLNTGIAVAGGRTTSTRGSAIYAVNGILGGTPDYLDGINGLTGGPVVNGEPTRLQTGDMAFVADPDGASCTVFVMDAEDGGDADGENVVTPVLNGGLMRWKRKESYFNEERVMNKTYPIGCTIGLTIPTNPADLYGIGTWEPWGVGCTPVCVDSSNPLFSEAGNTGGSADAVVVEHTHSAEVGITDPGHVHSYTRTPRALNCNNENDATGTGSEYSSDTGKAVTGISVSVTLDPVGSSGTSANLQPYICEYRWRRVS